MAVLFYTAWRVHPGRTQDFFTAAGEAKQIHERLGAKVRVSSWYNAGTGTGTYGYGMVFPDMEAWGRCQDAYPTDTAWLGWVQKHYDTPNVPSVLTGQYTASEIPGFEFYDAVEPGMFVWARGMTIAPDTSEEDYLASAAEMKVLALRHGARTVGLARITIGGEYTGMRQAVISFGSATEFGQFANKLNADRSADAARARAERVGTGIMDVTGTILPI